MALTRFQELKKRIRELGENLLPAISPTGTYTVRELDRVRGYRLLVHAEVESFLEECVRKVANDVLAGWNLDNKLRPALFCLIAFYSQQDIVSHKQLRDEYAGVKRRLGEALLQANQSFNRAVSQNNGVRERDVLRLLFPVGVKRTEIDPVWLGTIDSFGANRGEIAHSSIKTHQPLDPASELKTVQMIVDGLKGINQVLNRLGK